MNFDLDDRHIRIAASLRALLEEIAPTAVIAELDRREEFPADIYARLAESGYMGLTIAEEYGGNPADVTSLALVAEELARAGNALVAAWEPTVAFCAQAIQRFGTPQQRSDILPGIASGKLRIAMALSEPDAGSDLSHLSTWATRSGGDYVINGTKSYVTGADTAQYLLVFARTQEGSARTSLSTFLVPSTAAGLSMKVEPKLCSQGVHLCTVTFNELRVADTAVLGEFNGATHLVSKLLDNERILVGAKGVGIAQAAFDIAMRFAEQRQALGQKVIDFQAIGHVLADMAAEIEAARLLVFKAAWLRERGRDCALEASMAKLVGSVTGTRCAERGMQILGGYSYLVENGMERLYREAKLYEIGGGTSQIQRNVILRKLRSGCVASPLQKH